MMASSPSYNPNHVESNFDQIGAITRGLPAGVAAGQPGHRGPLPAGLDLQGRDRVGRARLAPLQADLDLRRPRLLHRLRQAGQQLRHEPARSARIDARDRAAVLGQLRVLQHRARRSARSGSSRQAKKFGFYERPPLETPESERLPERPVPQRRALVPEAQPDVDAGRMAFGQERLLVTPLQMAMVAGGDRQRRHPDAPVRRREARVAEGHDDRHARAPSGSIAPSRRRPRATSAR